MQPKASAVSLLEKLIGGLSVVFFFIFPLFFLTNVSEFNEYPKLILLITTAGLMLILWMVKSILVKRFVIARTPFDLVLLFMVIVFAVSTYFSVSPNVSLFGQFNSWHWTLVEMLALVGLFYAVVSNVQGVGQVRVLLMSIFSSAFVASLVSIIVYFNVLDGKQLPAYLNFLQVLAVDGFSTVGNTVSTLVLFLVGAFIGFFLIRSAMASWRLGQRFALVTVSVMSLPIIFGLVLWLAVYIPGLPGRSLPITQLDFSATWRIASSAIRDYPLWGTGPSTYSAAYNAYRPASINQTDYWNVVFDRGGNEYMSWMTTLGIVGVIALLGLLVQVVRTSRVVLLPTSAGHEKTTDSAVAELLAYRSPVVLGVLGILLVFFFTPSTVFTVGLMFMLLVVWMLIEKHQPGGLVDDVVLSLAAIKARLFLADGKMSAIDNQDQHGGQIMPWLVGVPTFVIVAVSMFYLVQDVRSNVAYAQSVRALNANSPAQEIYDAQGSAINLSPRRDAYHRAYAQTNITLAGVIATQRGESITDGERNDVVTLIQQAIREIRIITEVLDPASALNWQVRGNVYQNLLGVATGADQWALEAYQNAIRLAPLDPRLRVNIGSLYLTLAVSAPATDGTQGDAPAADAPQVPATKQANLVQAEGAFLDAIRLKPDYANAHFNLAAVYKEAQRYDLAKTELESTLRLLDPSSADYQTAQTELDQVTPLVTPTPAQ